jgi:hypothetical protein
MDGIGHATDRYSPAYCVSAVPTIKRLRVYIHSPRQSMLATREDSIKIERDNGCVFIDDIIYDTKIINDILRSAFCGGDTLLLCVFVCVQ